MAQIGSWELDIATQAMVWSDNMFRIFGVVSASSVELAEVMQNHIHPEDHPRLQQAIQRTSTEGTPYEIDLRFFRADGSMGYLESQAEAIRDQQGQVVKIFGTSLDITERKQAEAAITKSEVRYRKVVEAQTDLFCDHCPTPPSLLRTLLSVAP